MNILDIAKEADLLFKYHGYFGAKPVDGNVEEYISKLTKFAELLLAQERERCAKLCEENNVGYFTKENANKLIPNDDNLCIHNGMAYAEAIRNLPKE